MKTVARSNRSTSRLARSTAGTIASADGIAATMRMTCSIAASSATRRCRFVMSPSRSSRSCRSSRSPRSSSRPVSPNTDTVKRARSGAVTNPNSIWRNPATARYAIELTIVALHVPMVPKRNAPVMMTTIAMRYVTHPGSLEKRKSAMTRTVRSQPKEIAAILRCRSSELSRSDARRIAMP